MFYERETRHAGVESARALTHVVSQLLGHGIELLLASLIATAFTGAIGRRGLHWTWAAVSLAGAVLFAPLLGGVEPWAVIILALTALRGRRRHREALEAGLDLAAGARASRTPVASLRILGAKLLTELAHWRPRLPGPGGRLLLGRGEDGRRVEVASISGAGVHTLVVGATGSGKTVTQTLMAARAIEAGSAAIVVDPKGDRGMREHLRRAALEAGREMIEWSPTGPAAYNPYSHGSDTEIADRLLAGERFTEPHYMRQAQRYLGHAVRALKACGEEVSLPRVVQLLDPPVLEQLLRDAPEDHALAGHAYLDSLTPRQIQDLGGARDRLAILAESDVGRWVDPEAGATFNLLDAVRSGAVVYFSLESDSRPLLAQMLGAAIVQDLQSTVAALQGEPVPTVVVIDEFSAVAAEHVVALFGRARSAGFSLLLGTQEIADLRLPGRERILEQVMGNLSLLIAHRQVVPTSAELVSRLSGSRGTWRVTWGRGGQASRTRTEEPRLTPELLTSLAPGWAAVVSFGAGSTARVAHVIPLGGER
jgi:conjugal transfer pilus assembly protein TraD